MLFGLKNIKYLFCLYRNWREKKKFTRQLRKYGTVWHYRVGTAFESCIRQKSEDNV